MSRSETYSAIAFVLLGVASQMGCRACGSPYDYAPPVADCSCHGGCRSGSCLSEAYAVETHGVPLGDGTVIEGSVVDGPTVQEGSAARLEQPPQ